MFCKKTENLIVWACNEMMDLANVKAAGRVYAIKSNG